MTTNQTFAVTFIARTDRKDQGNYDIYVRITIDGKRTEFSVINSIPKESWNTSNERIDSKYKDFRKSNAYIDQVRAKVVYIYRDLSLKNAFISPIIIIIKNHFFGNVDNGKTLLELFEYHNKSQKNILKESTLLKYYTTQKYIVYFLRDLKKLDDIRLLDVDYQFVTDFDSFLRSYEPVDHHKPLANNGVMKHLERLRKVTSMAYRLEWIDKSPFEKYKFTFIKTDRGFLTKKELEILEEKNFEVARLQFVKDLFVFACYTDLLYIDGHKLTKDNLVPTSPTL